MLMKKKILGENVAPKCEYCKNGVPAADGEHILCEKMGILDFNFVCKKYVYDPLKRTPRRPTEAMEFTEDDFKL